MIPRTFVVPLDGSPFAERAVGAARAIARRVDGELLLVSADHRGPLEPREYLGEVAARCTDVPVGTLAHAEHLPADAILGVVGQSDDRILCMTSHGRGGLRWAMIGSVAEDVLRRASCPVLAVRLEGQP
jgi:nucleotide-binding universal stress UspA family protein